MKAKILQILGLSLGIALMTSTGHSAAIKDTTKPVHSAILNLDKQTPIEKALIQQKRGEISMDKDQIKVLASIKATASQNFLADQHQKFSRFLQSLFQPHSS